MDKWIYKLKITLLDTKPLIWRRILVREDVGGTGGYMDLIRIMKNPNHKEYESYIKWLGGKYDYTDFDINNVNKELTKRNFGIKYF